MRRKLNERRRGGSQDERWSAGPSFGLYGIDPIAGPLDTRPIQNRSLRTAVGFVAQREVASSLLPGLARKVPERIEHLQTGAAEILIVARHNGQSVAAGGRGDVAVSGSVNEIAQILTPWFERDAADFAAHPWGAFDD